VDPGTLRDAGRLLGVRVRPAEPGNGVVHVDIKSAERGLCGEALERVVGAESVRDALRNGVVDCQPQAWSCESPTFLAHELGHVFWLQHTKGGLMDPAPLPMSTVNQQQRTLVRSTALLFNEVCR
jgi:hypothetical protein